MINQLQTEKQYHRIEIVAELPETAIWLGDLDGCLVKKSVGKLDIGLMPGDYTVQFGLGTPVYPIHFDRDLHITQTQLATGPTCPRPVFKLKPE